MQKRNKKLIKILFFFSLLISIFNIRIIDATTIHDTTFYPEENDIYQWIVTKSSYSFLIGCGYNFTVESIYKGIHNSVDAMIVTATLLKLNPSGDINSTEINNGFYMAPNETQNYLRFVYYPDQAPIIFMTTIPINLTLVGDFLNTLPDISSYTVSGNTLTSIGSIVKYEQTFNSNGILTVFRTKYKATNALVGEIRLISEDGENGTVSIGLYSLVVLGISILALVYINIRKIK